MCVYVLIYFSVLLPHFFLCQSNKEDLKNLSIFGDAVASTLSVEPKMLPNNQDSEFSRVV
jgi:hypothetical protein